jgi:hypothetical protein
MVPLLRFLAVFAVFAGNLQRAGIAFAAEILRFWLSWTNEKQRAARRFAAVFRCFTTRYRITKIALILQISCLIKLERVADS